MKRSENFVKRKIGTQFVIVAVGEATKKFSGMISLNGTGSFIWDQLENDTTVEAVAKAVTDRYDVDGETARADAEKLINALAEVGAVEI